MLGSAVLTETKYVFLFRFEYFSFLFRFDLFRFELHFFRFVSFRIEKISFYFVSFRFGLKNISFRIDFRIEFTYETYEILYIFRFELKNFNFVSDCFVSNWKKMVLFRFVSFRIGTISKPHFYNDIS